MRALPDSRRSGGRRRTRLATLIWTSADSQEKADAPTRGESEGSLISKYVQYDCRDLKNLEVLLAALAALGWAEGKVEVHAEPQHMYGYTGDKRPEKANVIIRRNNTGISSSNDVGFLKLADGSYQPIVSDYDTQALRPGGVQFVQAVQNKYGGIMADKAIRTIVSTTIPRMKAKGLIPRHATVKTVPDGKSTKIVVSY